jgi:hypothetical protein
VYFDELIRFDNLMDSTHGCTAHTLLTLVCMDLTEIIRSLYIEKERVEPVIAALEGELQQDFRQCCKN